MLNEEMPTKYPEFEDIDALSGSQEEASAFEGEEGEEGGGSQQRGRTTQEEIGDRHRIHQLIGSFPPPKPRKLPSNGPKAALCYLYQHRWTHNHALILCMIPCKNIIRPSPIR